MEFTIKYSYNIYDDTKMTFYRDYKNEYTELLLMYTDKDPDYGTETMIFKGDAMTSLSGLCKQALNEITEFLDETDGGIYNREDPKWSKFEDLNNTSIIAFERMLRDFDGQYYRTDKKKPEPDSTRNKNGHEAMFAPISEIARRIRDKFVNDEVKAVYIAADIDDAKSIDDLAGMESWYKIIRMDLPFDNEPSEIALLMGYCGGGGVVLAYAYDDSDTMSYVERIEKMICYATGEDPDSRVYVEYIGVDDTHSYEIDHE